MLLFAPVVCSAAEYGPYEFSVTSVYDGDTIKGTVALWPGLVQKISVRVRGIDTPELRTKNVCEKHLAQKSRQLLVDFIGDKPVVISGVSLGKYAGRVLADVSVNGEDVAGYMISVGAARRYDGGKRSGWCQ